MRNIESDSLGALLEQRLPPAHRVVVAGNLATPWTLLGLVGRALPTYRLFVLNAQRSLPEGVTHVTPFVGPGVRSSPRTEYGPARLSRLPGLSASTHVSDLVLLHTTQPRNGLVSLGIEVNVLPAAIEQARRSGGMVVAQVNPCMPWTRGEGVRTPERTGSLDVEHLLVASFLFGSPELYPWVDENPYISMRRTGVTNDPAPDRRPARDDVGGRWAAVRPLRARQCVLGTRAGPLGLRRSERLSSLGLCTPREAQLSSLRRPGTTAPTARRSSRRWRVPRQLPALLGRDGVRGRSELAVQRLGAGRPPHPGRPPRCPRRPGEEPVMPRLDLTALPASLLRLDERHGCSAVANAAAAAGLLGGDVLVRSGSGPKLQAAERQELVALEVDDLDEADRSGWSLVDGRRISGASTPQDAARR